MDSPSLGWAINILVQIQVCPWGLRLEAIDREFGRFGVKDREVGPWVSYFWHDVVLITVWHSWKSDRVALSSQAIWWLFEKLTATTDTICMNLCKYPVCSWNLPPLLEKSMFSAVQIGVFHIIATPCMLWCIIMFKDFHICHLEHRIISGLSFDDSNQTKAPPALDFFPTN